MDSLALNGLAVLGGLNCASPLFGHPPHLSLISTIMQLYTSEGPM